MAQPSDRQAKSKDVRHARAVDARQCAALACDSRVPPECHRRGSGVDDRQCAREGCNIPAGVWSRRCDAKSSRRITRRRKYCSETCANLQRNKDRPRHKSAQRGGKRAKPVPCVACTHSFVRRHRTQRYCSVSCVKSAAAARASLRRLRGCPHIWGGEYRNGESCGKTAPSGLCLMHERRRKSRVDMDRPPRRSPDSPPWDPQCSHVWAGEYRNGERCHKPRKKGRGLCCMHGWRAIYRPKIMDRAPKGDPSLPRKRDDPEHQTAMREKAKRRRQHRNLANKQRALIVQRGVCPLCLHPINLKSNLVEEDHRNPFARGGGGGVANLQLVHRACNSKKKATPDLEWHRSQGLLL